MVDICFDDNDDGSVDVRICGVPIEAIDRMMARLAGQPGPEPDRRLHEAIDRWEARR